MEQHHTRSRWVRHGAEAFFRNPLAILLIAAGVARYSFSGCESAPVAPVPTRDELADALSGAMLEVVDQAWCDGSGTFWLDGDPWYQAMTGRSTGTAGIIKGLLAGLDELEAIDAVTDTSHADTIERIVSVVTSAADWLASHAEGDPDSNGLGWPACVTSVVPRDPETSACPEGIAAPDTIEPDCAAGLDQVMPGLQFGVAGIGDVFLDLADHSVIAPETQARFLAYAQASGDWLLAHAAATDHGTCWPDPLWNDAGGPLCDTSMARGIAGIGWFLTRLSHHVPDGSPYLDGARQAGDTLKSLMIPAGERVDDAWVPLNEQDPTAYTGFYRGNAGAAYFFMTLYQETGQAEYGDPARAILNWLAGDSVMVEALDGVTWPASPTHEAAGPYTGWDSGAAGIAWTFLQASRVFGTSDGDLEQAYLEVAVRAAEWLTHPEVAHYYQGLVWWPVQDRPWQEDPTLPAPALAQLDPVFDPYTQPWWWGDLPRAYLCETGLLRGGAGIGWFLIELRDTLAGQPDWACHQDLSDEVSADTLRWFYYEGQSPDGDGRWRWPASIVRTVDAQRFPAAPMPGYELGIAGILPYLGVDGATSAASDGTRDVPPLGFPSLTHP